MLTILIPVRDESAGLKDLFDNLSKNLSNINYEVLIINDFSTDDTLKIAKNIFSNNNNFKILDNKRKGLGGAVNLGIKEASGDNVVIMMADQSDDIEDLLKYNNLMRENDYDAILGSRFLKSSKVENYPRQKYILNRIFNYFVSLVFWNNYNDYTNAFKIYKKQSLNEIKPLISESFNIFLEIPLKIISRNYKYKIIPICWKERNDTETKIMDLVKKNILNKDFAEFPKTAVSA